MKPRIRIDRAVLVGVLAAALLLGTGVTAAYASMDDTPVPLAASASNPIGWWREGWGNSLYPDYTLNVPVLTTPATVDHPRDDALDGTILGTLYDLNRDPTLMMTGPVSDYFRSARPTGVHLTSVLDIPGTLLSITDPVEGLWYYHYLFYSNTRTSATEHVITVGVDMTPPGAVTGLQARSTVGGAARDWYPSKRAHISWTQGPYDITPPGVTDISGDAYYQVFIDGKPVIPEDGGTTQGQMFVFDSANPPSSITIEDMPSGEHTVTVAVVDRATNIGVQSEGAPFNSDPDYPTISVTVPPVTGGYAQITAVPRDAGGIASVDFSVDSSFVAQVTSAPYTVRVPVTVGAHTFEATATDMCGRTATASADAVVDQSTGFKTFITALIDGFTYPDALGGSPVRYLSTSRIGVSLAADRAVDAFAYTLSRSEGSSPSLSPLPGEPPTAFLPLSTVGGMSGGPITLDLASWNAVQTSPPSSIEGTWYLTARAAISDEYPPLSSSMRRVEFVIDVTPPAAPTGLAASDGLPTSTWTGSARRNLQWNNYPAGLSQYDALSGDDYFVVTVNGVERARTRPFLSLPFTYFSVEDLQAGTNVIGVSVVDRAGNRSAETVLSLLVDPDVPTITNTSPDRVGRFAKLSCVAADVAGIANVAWSVNGSPVGTSTTAPYGLTVDMYGFGPGTYPVTCTVMDMAGRTRSSTKNVTVVDVVAPMISGMSDSPDPFFPIKHDRYKDNSVIRFSVSERAYVALQIYDASGALVREIGAWKNAGANSFTWNGHKSNGAVSV
ncbi:MAG: hypothetical protein Q7W16_03260, partial [Coriobacteriia bacterium]|nr:hypothetical protein [Coriobacteriia bacterium]